MDYLYFIESNLGDFVRGVFAEDADYLYYRVVSCDGNPEVLGVTGRYDREFIANSLQENIITTTKRNPVAVKQMFAEFTDEELARMLRRVPQEASHA